MNRYTLALLAFFIAAACVTQGGSAHAAGCHARPLSETEEAFATDLMRRLKPLGVRSIDAVSTSSARHHYLVSGALFSMFLTEDDGLLKEIGFVLSAPYTAAETEKLMTSTAFTAAHFTGASEPAVKERYYADLARHPEGEWVEREQSFVTAFTKTSEGLVVKMATLTCD